MPQKRDALSGTTKTRLVSRVPPLRPRRYLLRWFVQTFFLSQKYITAFAILSLYNTILLYYKFASYVYIIMNIAVLGATGRTGAQIVEQALAAGHQVTAAARNHSQIARQHPRLSIVATDVMSASSIAGLLLGTDAVCSAIGSSTPGQPTTLYSASMAVILTAMKRVGIRRIIAVTAIPAEPDALKTAMERMVIHKVLKLFFGGAYQDMALMERILSASDADWTVLRPPRLTDGRATGHYRTAVDTRLPRAVKICRADLARAMLDSIDDPSLIRHAAAVAS
jgi:putative NADH-flavin reductase